MATAEQMAYLVGKNIVAFPNWTNRLDTTQVSLITEVYFEDLGHYPYDLLSAAFTKCRQESGREFAPSTGEIRGAVEEIQMRVEGIPTDLKAWDEICRMPSNMEKLISGENPDGSIYKEKIKLTWSHSLLGDISRMLGFPDFPRRKNGAFENEALDRAHFMKFYRQEISTYLNRKTEHPQVIDYIESTQSNQLGTGNAIQSLAEGMKK